jgi:hypothetical protein
MENDISTKFWVLNFMPVLLKVIDFARAEVRKLRGNGGSEENQSESE